MRSSNVLFTEHPVTLQQRWQTNRHRSGILWFTGLSASGKSTLAFALERELCRLDWRVFVLDGDNLRHGLCGDLGFSAEDRKENIRRVGEVAKLFAESGCLVVAALISPYQSDRRRVRAMAPGLFHEIFIDAPLQVCAERDPKGLYSKANRGQIASFTGITAPYEVPEQPELTINTADFNIKDSVQRLTHYVHQNFSL